MWADEQYPSTLFSLMREMTKLVTPKKKEKVGASSISKYIKED